MSEYWLASFILSASPKSFFPLIVTAHSLASREPPEVSQAFNKLVIPHSTREFVRDSLWLKLKVGERLKGWLPHQRMCPLCQEVETMAHSLYGCNFLYMSIDTISGVLRGPVPGPLQRTILYIIDPTSSYTNNPTGHFVVVCQACELESALPTATHEHSAYNTHISDFMVWYVVPSGVFQRLDC